MCLQELSRESWQRQDAAVSTRGLVRGLAVKLAMNIRLAYWPAKSQANPGPTDASRLNTTADDGMHIVSRQQHHYVSVRCICIYKSYSNHSHARAHTHIVLLHQKIIFIHFFMLV